MQEIQPQMDYLNVIREVLPRASEEAVHRDYFVLH